MPEPEPLAGRRAYDAVDPSIQLYVDKEVQTTRHLLKNEIAALGTRVATAQLQATKEHGAVSAAIEALRRDVAQLRNDLSEVLPLRERVTTLEGHDRTDDAVAAALKEQKDQLERNRVQFRNWALGISSLIVAATGILVGVLSG